MKKWLRLLPFGFITIACFLIFYRLIQTGCFFESHDGMRYPLLFLEFQEAMRQGILYPRWMANMYGGFGYPTFVFYQPGIFFLMTFLGLFITEPLLLMQLTLFLLFVLGGIGAYLLCLKLTDRFFAFWASLVFLMTPYLYCNLFVRGDFSELAGMLLTPWPFFLFLEIKARIQTLSPFQTITYSFLLSLALAAITLSHPFVALFFMPSFVILALIFCFHEKSWNRDLIFMLVASVMMSIALSSPYWLTLFEMKKFVQFGQALAGRYVAEDHIVHFKQFFSNTWGFGYSRPGSEDGMPFQLGALHFALASLGFLLGRKKPYLVVTFMVYSILILLMSPLSWLLWQKIPFLRFVQFPWRILSVTAVLQLLCLCGIYSWSKEKPNGLKAIAAVGIMVIGLLMHYRQFQPQPLRSDFRLTLDTYLKLRLHRFAALNAENEFLPIYVQKDRITGARDHRPLIDVQSSNSPLEEDVKSSPYHFRYRFTCSKPTGVIINQFYFPGWKILVDGKEMSDDELRNTILPDGRMRLFIADGKNGLIEGYYDGPPGKEVRNAIMALSCLGILTLLWHRKRLTVRSCSSPLKLLDTIVRKSGLLRK